jgi:putative heme iron utilization protein
MNDRPASPLPEDNRAALRRVIRASRKAALATLMAEGGAPYASLVTVAVDHDLSPILLMSTLADHTRNLEADPRASLLFDGSDGHANPQTGPRVTVVGRAFRNPDPRLAARFLARHPAARLYAGFADFTFWKLAIDSVHFVGGFARAVWFQGTLGLPAGAADAVTAAEPSVIEHMNADHADAIDRMATHWCGVTGSGWRLTGVDPDGCDLARGEEEFARLPFESVAADANGVRKRLIALSRVASG